MRRRPSRVAIALVPVLVVYYIVLMMGVSVSEIVFSLSGFGVDENGVLYIGEGDNVLVVDEGKIVLSKRMYRYTRYDYFLEVKDGNVVISNSFGVHVFDKNLELLDRQEDPKGSRLLEAKRRRYASIETTDGARYMYRDGIFGYRIIRLDDKGKAIVYTMPPFAYVMRTLLPVMIIVFVTVLLHFVSWRCTRDSP